MTSPNLLALVVRAREALGDGDVEFAGGILEELETRLVAEENRSVDLSQGSLVPDMSVFDEDEPG